MTVHMMRLFRTFRPGDKVTFYDDVVEVCYQDSDFLVLKPTNGNTPRLIELDTSDQEKLIADGDLKPYATMRRGGSSSFLNKREQQEAQAKQVVCELLSRLPDPTTKPTCDYVKEILLPDYGPLIDKSHKTYAKWLHRWRIAQGQSDSLAPQKYLRGHKSAIPEDEISFIERLYWQCIEINRNMSIKHMYSSYLELTEYVSPKTGEKLRYDAFRKYCNRIRPKNHESKAYNRTAVGRHKPNKILEAVEVDCTTVYGRFVRPDGTETKKIFLYIVVDVFSRSILGFHIDMESEGENTGAAAHALMLAASEKEDPTLWPMHGRFLSIYHDNGSAYISDLAQLIQGALCSNLIPTEVQTPWQKPFVERAFLNIQKNIVEVENFCIARKSSRQLDSTWSKRQKRLKPVDLEQLYKQFENYILRIYHHEPHSGLDGKSPYLAWMDQIHKGICIPSLIDHKDLTQLRGMSKYCKPSATGVITLEYEKFTSPDYKERLLEARKNLDVSIQSVKDDKDPEFPKLKVLYDPFDASSVVVEDPLTGKPMELYNKRGKDAEGKTFRYFKSINRQNKSRAIKQKEKVTEELKRRLNEDSANQKATSKSDTTGPRRSADKSPFIEAANQ